MDLAIHLLSFVAPAFVVASLVALAARFVFPGPSNGLSWWSQAAINTIAGGLTLAAGLWLFGADGKMATYAALVVAVASAQWACSRAWKA